MDGDEFVVFLPGVVEEEGQQALGCFNNWIDSFKHHHSFLPIRISLGVATGEKGTPQEIVLHEADRRLYAATRAGKEILALAHLTP